MIAEGGAVATAEAPPALPLFPAALPALPRQPTPGRTTVLVVDDEPDQLDLLCAWFRRAGCDVHGASSAVQALDLTAQFVFELFVVDLRMPGIGGWGLARTLRHIRGGGRVAICSVLDLQDYPPADDALPKPVSRADVTALLARQVAARSSR